MFIQTAERYRFPEFFGGLDGLNPAHDAERAFHAARQFLADHPLFKVNDESTFFKCLTISFIPAYLVADQTDSSDETGDYIMVECGPAIEGGMWSHETGVFEPCYLSTLDPRLTGVARTFEMAIREVASNVLLHYGAGRRPPKPPKKED